VRLKVYRSPNLWRAALLLFISAASYPDRNDGHGLPWHRYTWLLWLLAAAVAIFQAFRAAKSQPQPEAE
jgi:hypothetical protein